MIQKFLLVLIHYYQKISPSLAAFYASLGIPVRACKYQVSCSHYAREVISEYGTIRGTWLALKRLASCH